MRRPGQRLPWLWLLMLAVVLRTHAAPSPLPTGAGLDPADQQGAAFGLSVAGAGDVNGDGYEDVIVGAYQYDNEQPDEGRAYLYLGTANGLSQTPAWWADPTDQADAYFGVAVSGAGDVNGDGYADVIIGARGFNNENTDEGRAYLYLGGASGLGSTPGWQVDPANQDLAAFGYSVAGAGDVNGDGFADLIVGAYSYDNESTDEGRVYVYLGAAAGPSTTPVAAVDPADLNGAKLGFSVNAAGDVNGDGYGDVIAGAYQWDSTGITGEGRAYVFHGNASGIDPTPAWTADPTNSSSASFGISVASAGDVNGDGFSDVIIGASLLDTSAATDEGRAYLYLGGAAGLANTPAWFSDPTDNAGANFGYSVASAGDLNGDGYSDVMVGAYGFGGAGFAGEGRAYLFFGGAAGLAVTPGWVSDPTNQTNANFGVFKSGAGDVNGDGFGDLAIGAFSWTSTTFTDEGRLYFFAGAADGVSAHAATLDPTDQPSSAYGYALSSAGDVNGDGFGDVIVGAWSSDIEQNGEGRAFVHLGSAAGLASTPAWTVHPTDQANAYFGYSVAGAGDVNGDGYADVLVGAYSFDGEQPDEGRAYLYLGGASGLSSTAAWVLDPTDESGAEFGISVAGAGDVNRDGYADVVIGALKSNGDVADEGRAYVFMGSASGLLQTPAVILESSDQTLSRYASAVAAAGDVNGDGYADVLVSASNWDGEQLNEGRAYVYLGGPTGLSSTPGWTADPTDQPAAAFGVTIATAGDVNGDGFSDVIVGAEGYDTATASAEGRAYFYPGGPAGLSAQPAWMIDPTDQAQAYAGQTVGAAGDVNGDGFDDLFVGAYAWDGAQALNEGGAYVFLGGKTGPSSIAAWSREPADVQAAFFGFASAATDVNADGFSDLLVGAYQATGSAANEGRVWVYPGGDLGQWGLSRGLAQVDPGTAARLGVGNKLSDTGVELRGRVTQENGVGGQLRLEVEVKPVGVPFDGAGTIFSPETKAGSSVTVKASNLAAGAYRWRARTVYAVGTGHGRWAPFGGNSDAEADFVIIPPPAVAITATAPAQAPIGAILTVNVRTADGKDVGRPADIVVKLTGGGSITTADFDPQPQPQQAQGKTAADGTAALSVRVERPEKISVCAELGTVSSCAEIVPQLDGALELAIPGAAAGLQPGARAEATVTIRAPNGALPSGLVLRLGGEKLIRLDQQDALTLPAISAGEAHTVTVPFEVTGAPGETGTLTAFISTADGAQLTAETAATFDIVELGVDVGGCGCGAAGGVPLLLAAALVLARRRATSAGRKALS